VKKEQGGASEQVQTISATNDPTQQQLQVKIDDSKVTSTYSTTVRVWNSPEEINLDFAGPLRQLSSKDAVLKIEQRIIVSPFSAKRLAIALAQAVARYEHTYGTLELDAQKRVVNRPDTATKSKLS